jgi:protocatechuate 3,4-dioxygenase beta subunit
MMEKAMSRIETKLRNDLIVAVLTVAFTPLGLQCWNGSALAQTKAATAQKNDTAWRIVLVSEGEPGEPMVVTGTVYAPDGKTPATGIEMYVYHTDAEGYYRKGNNSSNNPRLKGTMITNAEGKYEYRTIKPAAYPGGGNPAHVHYVITGKGYAKQYDELQFEGDRWLKNHGKLTEEQKADTFHNVRPLAKDKDGVWRVVKDIRLE